MNLSSIAATIVALLLPTRSVDAIVSILTKVAERLAAAEAAQNSKADGLRGEAERLIAAANAATAEAARARRVRSNLAKLTD